MSQAVVKGTLWLNNENINIKSRNHYSN